MQLFLLDLTIGRSFTRSVYRVFRVFPVPPHFFRVQIIPMTAHQPTFGVTVPHNTLHSVFVTESVFLIHRPFFTKRLQVPKIHFTHGTS